MLRLPPGGSRSSTDQPALSPAPQSSTLRLAGRETTSCRSSRTPCQPPQPHSVPAVWGEYPTKTSTRTDRRRPSASPATPCTGFAESACPLQASSPVRMTSSLRLWALPVQADTTAAPEPSLLHLAPL